MAISATILNGYNIHNVSVSTEGREQKLNIPGKESGYGSAINGGELLFLALATCFCNDVYREAAKRKLEIISVEVTVTGDFIGEGNPASNIKYSVQVLSDTVSQAEIEDLIAYVDSIAEVHNTLRQGIEVTLIPQEAKLG